MNNLFKKINWENDLVIITSGGTSVIIDKDEKIRLENFSTGTRGSRMAEYLL